MCKQAPGPRCWLALTLLLAACVGIGVAAQQGNFPAGGQPGGSNTQVQFNNGGAFAGSSGLTYASGTGTLTITAQSTSGGLKIVDGASTRTVLNANINAGGTSSFVIGDTGAASFHVNQGQANTDFSGKLACATSTVTKTFALGFTSVPMVFVFDETTKGGANLTAISASAFTVSCTGATDALDYIVIGNPN